MKPKRRHNWRRRGFGLWGCSYCRWQRKDSASSRDGWAYCWNPKEPDVWIAGSLIGTPVCRKARGKA